MKNENDILETIEQYLNGKMSPEERVAFEKAVAKDSELASKVDEIKYTEEAVLLANLSILKEDIGKEVKKITYKPASKIKKGRIISILALAGISIAGISLLNNEHSETPDQIKADPISENIADKEISPSAETASDKNIEHEAPSHPLKKHADDVENASSDIPEITQPDDEMTVIEPVENVDKDTSAVDLKIKSNKENTSPDTSSVKKKEPKKSACDKVFKIKPSASCPQRATGTISVASDKAYSYAIKLDNSRTNHSNGIFYDVPVGKHSVTIKYLEECIYEETVNIEKKWCPLNTSYSFNPEYGEKWEIQYENGDEGVFMIYNGLGKELYKSEFGDGGEYWDGTDTNGNLMPTDTYQAIIKYADGRYEKVILTIAR